MPVPKAIFDQIKQIIPPLNGTLHKGQSGSWASNCIQSLFNDILDSPAGKVDDDSDEAPVPRRAAAARSSRRGAAQAKSYVIEDDSDEEEEEEDDFDDDESD